MEPTAYGLANCPVCGTENTQRPGQRGRPREYCSVACRKLTEVLALAEQLVFDVATHCDQPHRNALRRRLWYVANCANRRRLR